MRPGFLNDNRNRAYPFIAGRTGTIPDCAVVDFGSTMLAGAGYIEGEHSVWLEWIRRIGSTIEFCFRSDAPGLLDKALIFQRDKTDPHYVTSFAYAQSALTQEQLDAACECGFNAVCNPSFSATEAEASSLELVESGSSSSYQDACLDKYPGSSVYAWQVTAGCTQVDDLLRIQVAPLSIESALQIVQDFYTGQDLKLYADVVSVSSTSGQVVISLNGPDENTVISQVTANAPGLYGVTGKVPAGGTVYVKIRAVNLSTTDDYFAEVDNVSLQYCVSNDSSYSEPLPDPEVCPSDTVWEGFLVTGDMPCLLKYLEDCTRVGGVPGGEGAVDVLFLTDTTGSMGNYINTIKAVFSPLANTVTELLPQVSFLWAAANYKDFEDGPEYASGVVINSKFTSNIGAVQSAIGVWSAGGGGDQPEQNLAALLRVAQHWADADVLAGREDAQRMIIWGGDVPGWENGSKGKPHPTLMATIQALVEARIKVFAINNQSEGSGLDGICPRLSGIAVSGLQQASTIINATGGQLENNVSQNDAERIARIVADAIITTVEIPPTVVGSSLEGPAFVEPSRTKNLDGSYVRSFVLANADRTRATSPEGCRDLCWPFARQDFYVRCECVSSEVRFVGGCNAVVRTDTNTNAIIIDGDPGGGDDCRCGEQVAVTPLEAPPRGRTRLDGALGCDEIVRSFNGVSRQIIRLYGGKGVTVRDMPEFHRIVIDIDLHSLALCPAPAPEIAAVCIPPSSDPCDCGPLDTGSFSCPEGMTTPEPVETTTTPGPDDYCGGPCEWIRQHNVGEEPRWVLLGGGCEDDCECFEPPASGTYYTGELRQTNCVRLIPECLLYNPEFESASYDATTGRVTDLPGWNLQSTTTPAVFYKDECCFALMPIRYQGPVLRLDASEADVTVWQQFPVTPGRRYLLRVYTSWIQGDVLVGLMATDGVTILTPDSRTTEPGEPGDAGLFSLYTYTAPATGHLRVFFRASNRLTYSGRGLMDVAGVCVTELD